MINNSSTTHGSIHPGRRRMKRRPIVVLAVGSAAACGLLAGCGGSGDTAGAATQGSGQGQSITLFSGQHEQTTNGLVTAFEKQTGIKVNVRNDDEDTLANLIAVQG
jgi:iron(III) transport system substrate-binding protein